MICCVTGNRPKGFPFIRKNGELKFNSYLDILNHEIDELIGAGIDHFISGFADGADIDFAVCVSEKTKKCRGLIFEAALPYPKDINKIYEEHGKSFVELKSTVTDVTEVSDHYFRGCMQKRNRYMVDKSDIVLAIWNGEKIGGTWYTINYALKKGKTVKYIYLCEI